MGFAADLIVYARDHRRLHRGVWSKTIHSLVRCTLLYLDLMPSRWRAHDWGYWASPQGRDKRNKKHPNPFKS